MKSKNLKKLLSVLAISAMCAACSKVPPGYVGVKVNTAGGDRGVDSQPYGVGYYYTGLFTDYVIFPTFTQNYTFTQSVTEGVAKDESISFSDSQGLTINTDIGISYHVQPDMAPKLYQTYRQGIDEITSIVVRNTIRNALIDEGSKHPVEWIYGAGRPQLLAAVQKDVSQVLTPKGLIVDNIYWIGQLRLPDAVQAALNAKIAAVQQSQQRENEVATAQAQAQKDVAQAQGEANAILVKAQAQAKANQILSESLTPELVEYMKAQKWNGQLPSVVSGQNGLLMSVNSNR